MATEKGSYCRKTELNRDKARAMIRHERWTGAMIRNGCRKFWQHREIDDDHGGHFISEIATEAPRKFTRRPQPALETKPWIETTYQRLKREAAETRRRMAEEERLQAEWEKDMAAIERERKRKPWGSRTRNRGGKRSTSDPGANGGHASGDTPLTKAIIE